MTRTYLVGPEHPVTKGELEGDAAEFFERWCTDGTADGAVLAKLDGELVGWLRYYLLTPINNEASTGGIQAAGTWVEPGVRCHGVAQALWARVMRAVKPKRVVITTVSPEGRHLVGSIVRWFPKVTFEVRAGY